MPVLMLNSEIFKKEDTMTVPKCKMCGGDLDFEDGATVVDAGQNRLSQPSTTKSILLCSSARTGCAMPASLIRRPESMKALWRTSRRRRRHTGDWCYQMRN